MCIAFFSRRSASFHDVLTDAKEQTADSGCRHNDHGPRFDRPTPIRSKSVALVQRQSNSHGKGCQLERQGPTGLRRARLRSRSRSVAVTRRWGPAPAGKSNSASSLESCSAASLEWKSCEAAHTTLLASAKSPLEPFWQRIVADLSEA